MSTPVSFTILTRGLLEQYAAQGASQSLGFWPTSIAMSQDLTTIVGGAAASGGNVAYVFRRSTVTDNWLLLQQPLQPALAGATPAFGQAVTLTGAGETIAVTAPNNLGGRVYLYTNNTTASTLGAYQYFQILQGSGIADTGTTAWNH